ncbi:MAG: class I SAM-dependent methyltransferase [Proteobacteria bacterium]|nr:class I SAM-dependent methyltransferase [Pseudomonadota bacterium]
MPTPAPPDHSAPRSGAVWHNRIYYEKDAVGRDDYWRKMAAPRHRVAVLRDEIVRTRPTAAIDLGCGNGAFLAELARRVSGLRLAGVDLSERQIARNRADMPGFEWHAADLEQPLSNCEELVGRFDAVIASEIVEHLDHPDRMLRNALAVARPGRGRLFLSTQSGPVRETERRVGHRRHYQKSELRALLRKSGWLPLRVWNTGFPFHDLSKWYANRNPDAAMERFGSNAYGWSENLICTALRLAFRLNSSRCGAQLFAVAVAGRDAVAGGSGQERAAAAAGPT